VQAGQRVRLLEPSRYDWDRIDPRRPKEGKAPEEVDNSEA